MFLKSLGKRLFDAIALYGEKNRPVALDGKAQLYYNKGKLLALCQEDKLL